MGRQKKQNLFSNTPLTLYTKKAQGQGMRLYEHNSNHSDIRLSGVNTIHRAQSGTCGYKASKVCHCVREAEERFKPDQLNSIDEVVFICQVLVEIKETHVSREFLWVKPNNP